METYKIEVPVSFRPRSGPSTGVNAYTQAKSADEARECFLSNKETIQQAQVFYTDMFVEVDTHGIPLSSFLHLCHKHGLRYSVPHFVSDALAAGWKSHTIKARFLEAWSDLGLSRSEVSVLEASLCELLPK